MSSLTPLWTILVSLLASVLILLSNKRPNVRETWTFLAAFIKFGLVLSMLPIITEGKVIECSLIQIAPSFDLALRVDTLGMLFALVASSLWIATSFYSVGYMRSLKYKHQTLYFSSFAVCLAATMGIAFSANLFTFFIFYELLTLATYPLVVHNRNEEARKAGRKYLAYTLTAGQFLLVGILWCHFLLPGADFVAGGFLNNHVHGASAILLFLCFLLGFGVKAGLMPFHGWLPDAMVAPTPVSALLHAVAVVKAGVFGILRVTGYVFGPDLLFHSGAGVILMSAAIITILVASLRAMGETKLKRRLAYSTVSQLSYILLGASLFSPFAFLGAVFHVAGHAFMKITLFFSAGAIYAKTHKDTIPELRGLGKEMPITMMAFTLGAIGMAGIPLLPGFLSKLNIALGSIATGQVFIVVVLVLSGLLNIAYFFPIVRDAFFESPEEEKPRSDGWKITWIPLAITGVMALLIGTFPNVFFSFFQLAQMTAFNVFGGY